MASRLRTRREVLKTVAKAAAGASLGNLLGCFPDVGGEWPYVTEACLDEGSVELVAGASKVVEVVREAAVRTDPVVEIQAVQIEEMLTVALRDLGDGAKASWRVLLPEVTPATRVGLKVNCLNKDCATSVPLTRAVVESLRAQLELPLENVIVWDRRLDELEACGFSEQSVGATVMGTVASTEDLSGPGYTEPICGVVGGKTPRLSRILTDLTDVTVNVPVLKTHGVSGVTAALKNIYGIIDNPGDYHTNLNTAMPQLYRLPPIRSRIRLTIVDALIAVTTGGTSSPPDTVPKRVLAALDPLALDNYCLALVNRLRAEKGVGLKDIDPTFTAWLENGFALGLGTLEYTLAQHTL